MKIEKRTKTATWESKGTVRSLIGRSYLVLGLGGDSVLFYFEDGLELRNKDKKKARIKEGVSIAYEVIHED